GRHRAIHDIAAAAPAPAARAAREAHLARVDDRAPDAAVSGTASQRRGCRRHARALRLVTRYSASRVRCLTAAAPGATEREDLGIPCDIDCRSLEPDQAARPATPTTAQLIRALAACTGRVDRAV